MAEMTLKKELVLQNKYGLHVRPAGLFAKIASRFNAEVEVEKDGNVVSGKSIMALMTLEAVCGTRLVVTATGPQAAEVLEELEALVSTSPTSNDRLPAAAAAAASVGKVPAVVRVCRPVGIDIIS